MSQQGARQASFRTIGGTTGTYNGDMLAAIEAEIGPLPAGTTINGAFILWLQQRLDSTNPSLPGKLAEWAAAEGASGATSIGTFDPSEP